MRSSFPECEDAENEAGIIKIGEFCAAYELREFILTNPNQIGEEITIWVTASDDVDMLLKGKLNRDLPADLRQLSDQQLLWLDQLMEQNKLEMQFNWTLYKRRLREPEQAGIAGAMIGSFYSVMVCLLISFPLGVLAAIYLESFAPKNAWTSFIEVNINNLAAVPSIVFGLLGLAVFLNFLSFPDLRPLWVGWS